MNEATISRIPRFATLVGQAVTWLIDPSVQEERGEDFSFRTFSCKLGGGLFRFVINSFVKTDHKGVQFGFGILRFHFDVDIIYIYRPENEIRNDKRTNKFAFSDATVDYRSWFIGFEGVGIYRKHSMVQGYGISELEIGAHPICNIGFINLYHQVTQHAIIGMQFANLQLTLHSAFDQNLNQVSA